MHQRPGGGQALPLATRQTQTPGPDQRRPAGGHQRRCRPRSRRVRGPSSTGRRRPDRVRRCRPPSRRSAVAPATGTPRWVARRRPPDHRSPRRSSAPHPNIDRAGTSPTSARSSVLLPDTDRAGHDHELAPRRSRSTRRVRPRRPRAIAVRPITSRRSSGTRSGRSMVGSLAHVPLSRRGACLGLAPCSARARRRRVGASGRTPHPACLRRASTRPIIRGRNDSQPR